MAKDRKQVEDCGTEILRVLCGSRAYGLATSDSDFDYHGVFVAPTHQFAWMGNPPPETSFILGKDVDNVSYEIRHFLRMAVNGNPTVLETFVAPVEESNSDGDNLRQLLPHVLARKLVYEGFKGYASNQRKKMFDPGGNTHGVDRETKFAIAWIRSLYHGRQLLLHGTYETYIDDAALRSFLMEIRKTPFNPTVVATITQMAMEMEEQLKLAFALSTLPMEADMEAVEDFVLAIRAKYW